MKITFLGTGTSQGVPVIGCNCEVCRSLDFRDKRLRTSIHIEIDQKSLVIDTGPDFRQQMLREGINHLDGVIYTHEHKDHTAGLDDVRPFNFMQGKDMPIYARKPVLNQIKSEYAYIFTEHRYPGVPLVRPHQIENKSFEVEGVEIIPIEAMHYRLPVFGYRIKDFTYITDAKFISPQEMKKVYGSRVLVLNALQQKAHISHLTLEEAIAIVKEINPETAYFTHMSHSLGLHSEVEKKLPDNTFLAYDGLKLTLE